MACHKNGGKPFFKIVPLETNVIHDFFIITFIEIVRYRYIVFDMCLKSIDKV